MRILGKTTATATVALVALLSVGGCTSDDPADNPTAGTSGSSVTSAPPTQPTLPPTTAVTSAVPSTPTDFGPLPEDVRAAFVGIWTLAGMQQGDVTRNSADLAQAGVTGELTLQDTGVVIIALGNGEDTITEPGTWTFASATHITITLGLEPAETDLLPDGTLQLTLPAATADDPDQLMFWERAA